ncbi:MAG: hypothetical protein HY291_19930 [Planctomycetes bacterium]|nr:hypothetical protein [Planctomycetota bacterium]
MRSPPDRLKLYALCACGLLFLACCGLGGFLIYYKYIRTPPPPSPAAQPVDITSELKGAHGKGKELYQVAKEALDQEDLPTALEKFIEARDIWDSASGRIAELMEKPEYQKEKYKSWQNTASQLQSDLLVVNDEIFKLEQRIAREKNTATSAQQ